MEGNGIMQEIRTLLSQGKSSGEVIALGYKPPTVYKVQHQLTRKTQGNRRVSASGSAQPPAATADNQLRSELEAENIRLRQEVEPLEGQLECVVDADAELEARVQTLQGRVKALENEAAAAGQLRQRVQELEGQLAHAGHTQATMQQSIAAQWRGKVAAEQGTLQKLEEWAGKIWPEHQRLQAELKRLQKSVAEAYPVFQSLAAEVGALRPLKVWTGHPCKVCKQPLPGIVSREDAAKAMKDFGHTACQENQGPGFGELLVVGGVLLGLSQLNKR